METTTDTGAERFGSPERFRSAEQIVTLLRLLPPAPTGWVAAAQQLPGALAGLDDLVARATQDAEARARTLADLEEALASAGIEPSERTVDLLRRRLEA